MTEFSFKPRVRRPELHAWVAAGSKSARSFRTLPNSHFVLRLKVNSKIANIIWKHPYCSRSVQARNEACSYDRSLVISVARLQKLVHRRLKK